MANKARYYGLSTKEERQDVTMGSGVYPETGGVLTYSAVVTAIRNYKATHPNFDNLSATAAASAIAKELDKSGKFGDVSAGGARIKGAGYSIALTKGKGIITASKASEQVNTDKKKKK